MGVERKSPADVARRLGERRDRHSPRPEARSGSGAWRRETFTLPREEARALAKAWFERFPKAAYMTEIESWRELADGSIEFTMRRLPTAD
jgi:hypothetical protein